MLIRSYVYYVCFYWVGINIINYDDSYVVFFELEVDIGKSVYVDYIKMVCCFRIDYDVCIDFVVE